MILNISPEGAKLLAIVEKYLFLKTICPKDKKAINELFAFSESISKETREEQRAFLSYCSEIFRDSLHYRTKSEDSSKKYTNELDLKKLIEKTEQMPQS